MFYYFGSAFQIMPQTGGNNVLSFLFITAESLVKDMTCCLYFDIAIKLLGFFCISSNP